MKKITLGISLILLLTLSVSAQKQRNGEALRLESGTYIEAQLEGALDVKKSKLGDAVVLKTTKAVRQNGRVVIEKGARLIGRVTEVQQKTRQNGTARLGVVFEKIQGNNLNAPISATIVSITQATADTNIGDSSDSDISGRSSSSGSVSSSSGSSGGLLSGVGNTVGGVVNTTTQTVSGVTGTTARTLGRTVNGIQISGSTDASAGASTTLSTSGNNLRLEKGARFQLRLSESARN